MSDLSKDALDHLCATDPIWITALQIVQLARQSSGTDPVLPSVKVMCALILLASDAPDPQAFLERYANNLRKTPLRDR